jgi:competence protein ComEC
VATAPLMAFHFEQVSLASLPANLAAAAAVAPVMWLGMVAIAVAQVSPALCVPLNALNGPLLAYVEWVAHVAAQPPAAALPVRLGGPAALALAYAALAALIALAGRASRWTAARPAHARALRVTAAAAGVLGVGVVVVPALGTPHAPQPGDFVVSFLNIGQGDATLLQHGGASILFDTGPPGGPILRRLKEAGVRRLDLLVTTHAQLDHEGMAVPVARAYRPRLVLDGGAGWSTPTQRGLPATGVRAVPAHQGQQLELGGIRLRLLWPPRPPPGWRPEGDPNNRAVVAIASVGSFDVLLTADAESDITGPLQLPPVEALKVAHHGSEDPGLPALLARTRPAFAGIEVGRGNTYGHPTQPTLAELRAVVPHVYRTDRDGTVRLHVTAAGVTVEHAP